MKWTKKANGWYESECGRFCVMQNTLTRKWSVADRHVKDVCLPQYDRSSDAVSLAHAKRIAARWLRAA